MKRRSLAYVVGILSLLLTALVNAAGAQTVAARVAPQSAQSNARSIPPLGALPDIRSLTIVSQPAESVCAIPLGTGKITGRVTAADTGGNLSGIRVAVKNLNGQEVTEPGFTNAS